MTAFYHTNVTVHVLAAMLWLGGMFFFGIIGAPVLRAIEPPALRQQLFQQLGIRARAVGWWAIGVLLVTGIINLHYRGWLRWTGVLGSIEFWQTAAGHVLALELGAVAAMVLVSAIHDFVLGPMAGRAQSGSPSALALSVSSHPPRSRERPARRAHSRRRRAARARWLTDPAMWLADRSVSPPCMTPA